MNYKTTNRLLRKNSKRAIFYQVLCGLGALAIIAPASYIYGVMQAGEGVNFPLYERVFSETVVPEGSGAMPEYEIAEALLALGPAAIERTTYNNLIIWTATLPAQRNGWQHDLARQWARQGIGVQADRDVVQGMLRLGRDRCVLLAKASEKTGSIEIFALRQSEFDEGQAFIAAGLPEPPRHAQIFDYSGSTDTGVALAFRSDAYGDLVAEYGNLLERQGWRPLPVPPDREGASLYERDGSRVTLRGMQSGNYTYVTLVVF